MNGAEITAVAASLAALASQAYTFYAARKQADATRRAGVVAGRAEALDEALKVVDLLRTENARCMARQQDLERQVRRLVRFISRRFGIREQDVWAFLDDEASDNGGKKGE